MVKTNLQHSHLTELLLQTIFLLEVEEVLRELLVLVARLVLLEVPHTEVLEADQTLVQRL
jgi:hypothetical protein